MKSNVRAALAAGACLLALCGCGGPEKKPAAAGAPQERRYPLTGEVVSVDAAKHTLRIQHEAVPDLMPGMTMDFAASAGDVAVVHPGERIRADLVRDAKGEFHLEKIWPDDRTTDAVVAAGAQSLRQDTLIRGRSAYREVGEAVPDFALYDQTGKVVQSSRFQGRQIMLNFIYTRCPVATMCPAATLNMMATQRLAREAGIKNVEFVSISFDPDDTPGMLRDYADARGIDTSNFTFLTGPEGAIKDLLTQFGVIAEFEGGVAKHTLATLLIDENGRIVHRADGSGWEPKDFVAKMHRS
ncbi:MAG TPA: SCO family protein [Opitutaceae bacterium]|nr:SCO family protein [Opitutaceae bacterium]